MSWGDIIISRCPRLILSHSGHRLRCLRQGQRPGHRLRHLHRGERHPSRRLPGLSSLQLCCKIAMNVRTCMYLLFGPTAFTRRVAERLEDILDKAAQAGVRACTIRDSSQRTPLHAAAQVGWEWGVDALCSVGFEVNAKTADGKTPLQMAVHTRNLQVVGSLMERYESIQ